jgi:hypothetical protein
MVAAGARGYVLDARSVGGLDSIDLADGNRVHVEPLDCMIEFGQRWRGDAQRALIALGLEPPDFEEIES